MPRIPDQTVMPDWETPSSFTGDQFWIACSYMEDEMIHFGCEGPLPSYPYHPAYDLVVKLARIICDRGDENLVEVFDIIEDDYLGEPTLYPWVRTILGHLEGLYKSGVRDLIAAIASVPSNAVAPPEPYLYNPYRHPFCPYEEPGGEEPGGEYDDVEEVEDPTEFINSLKDVDLAFIAADDMECPICLESFDSLEAFLNPNNEPVQVPCCSKYFCRDCLFEALSTVYPRCPMCRQDVIQTAV